MAVYETKSALPFLFFSQNRAAWRAAGGANVFAKAVLVGKNRQKRMY